MSKTVKVRKVSSKPYNAEMVLYKLWGPNGFLNLGSSSMSLLALSYRGKILTYADGPRTEGRTCHFCVTVLFPTNYE